jgi:hypothetical protein
MSWWQWVAVGIGCWFGGNLLLLGVFVLLSFRRGEEQPSGEDAVTLG